MTIKEMLTNLSDTELIYYLCDSYHHRQIAELGTQEHKDQDARFIRAIAEIKKRLEDNKTIKEG